MKLLPHNWMILPRQHVRSTCNMAAAPQCTRLLKISSTFQTPTHKQPSMDQLPNPSVQLSNHHHFASLRCPRPSHSCSRELGMWFFQLFASFLYSTIAVSIGCRPCKLPGLWARSDTLNACVQCFVCFRVVWTFLVSTLFSSILLLHYHSSSSECTMWALFIVTVQSLNSQCTQEVPEILPRTASPPIGQSSSPNSLIHCCACNMGSNSIGGAAAVWPRTQARENANDELNNNAGGGAKVRCSVSGCIDFYLYLFHQQHQTSESVGRAMFANTHPMSHIFRMQLPPCASLSVDVPLLVPMYPTIQCLIGLKLIWNWVILYAESS